MEFLRSMLQQVVLAKEPPKPEPEEEEEEVVDPVEELREACTELKKINALFEELQNCNDRVSSKTKTAETCEQELFDFIHARDHCVAKQLFSRLE